MEVRTREDLKVLMNAPLYRKDSLQIVVKRFYTDVNGTILDKNDAAIPDALKVQMPVYLFGEFDRQGAYYLGLKNLPPQPGVNFLLSFVYGISNPFIAGFSGLSDIENNIAIGDLVNVYTDDLNAPNIFIWMVQHIDGRSLGSIMQNLPSLPVDPQYGYLKIFELDYYADNENQWRENMQYITYDFLGLVKSDNLQPFTYKTPLSYQNGFVAIRMESTLSQYLGLNTYMLFESDSITFNFLVKIRKP